MHSFFSQALKLATASAVLLICMVEAIGAISVISTVPLFDGRTLNGWEGNPKLWRVQDGAITGGSLTETIELNEFLCTAREFTNFVLRLGCRPRITMRTIRPFQIMV